MGFIFSLIPIYANSVFINASVHILCILPFLFPPPSTFYA